MATSMPLQQKVMLLSIAAAIVTIILKFGAWAMTGSVGLFSDAAESVVNLFAASFAFYALRLSALPPDDGHEFGHDKIEYFSSGLEGLLIFIAAGAIIYAAADRLLHPAPVESLGMGLMVSLLASGVNAAVALIMLRVAKQQDSIVLEADAHHLMTDVWTSVGVVAGLLLVMWLPQAGWLDPAIAILVALNILRTAWELLRRSLNGLMDAALPPRETELLRRVLKEALAKEHTDGRVGRLRTRKSGSRRFVNFNLWLPDTLSVVDAHDLCDRLEDAIHAEFANSDINIHVEPLSMHGASRESLATGRHHH